MARTLSRPRRGLDADDATAELERARRTYDGALDAVNVAIRARAELVYRAHEEAGMSWQAIATVLGVRKHTAMQLARRWENARAAGRRLGIGPQSRQ